MIDQLIRWSQRDPLLPVVSGRLRQFHLYRSAWRDGHYRTSVRLDLTKGTSTLSGTVTNEAVGA